MAVTFNGGGQWTNVSQQMPPQLPPRYVTQVALDFRNPRTAYATFSGFSGFVVGDNKGHVFKTTNGGASWTDISGGLPNIPVNDLEIDTSLPNTLYIATDIGVFVTNNGGASWSTLGTGLPNVAVLSLTVKYITSGNQLVAATHGRGAWIISLSE